MVTSAVAAPSALRKHTGNRQWMQFAQNLFPYTPDFPGLEARLFSFGMRQFKCMYYDLLSTAERDAVVASHLRDHLPMLGLREIGPRIWVDGSRSPIRRLFELQLLKGACLKASWGFSLDFVPRIAAGRVRWHRSDKTARLDVVIDPRDLPQPTYIHGSARLANDLRDLLREAIPRVQDSWRRCMTVHGLLDIIRELRSQGTNCFGYHNYTQLPLAYAFLCAKEGDLETANQELDQYVTELSLDDDEVMKLKKLTSDYAKPETQN